jgi:hypothetical protein
VLWQFLPQHSNGGAIQDVFFTHPLLALQAIMTRLKSREIAEVEHNLRPLPDCTEIV